jgi:hypothetical protein
MLCQMTATVTEGDSCTSIEVGCTGQDVCGATCACTVVTPNGGATTTQWLCDDPTDGGECANNANECHMSLPDHEVCTCGAVPLQSSRWLCETPANTSACPVQRPKCGSSCDGGSVGNTCYCDPTVGGTEQCKCVDNGSSKTWSCNG